VKVGNLPGCTFLRVIRGLTLARAAGFHNANIFHYTWFRAVNLRYHS
jgi:hypothetical protein